MIVCVGYSRFLASTRCADVSVTDPGAVSPSEGRLVWTAGCTEEDHAGAGRRTETKEDPTLTQLVETGMVIDKDVSIPLRDGTHVVANVFRPAVEGRWPVILTYGPYGKDVHFGEYWPEVFAALKDNHPEITEHSSLRHMVFETPDPEVWTRFGYAVVRVDSRGAGKSRGLLAPNSPQEFIDAADAVEWAGRASWSNGRVGLIGISYYAAGQWMIAQHRPPHLAAMQPWQGTSDFYRDRTRKGGIFSSGFVQMWWNSVVINQYGNGDSPLTDYFTGERNTGPALSAGELAANRVDYIQDILDHPLEDDWYKARSADLSQIDIPTLVGANWGGLQVHLRGTILGFTGIASRHKWLRVQRGSYFEQFYLPENAETQRRFFDRYLKGDESAWADEPKVQLVVRGIDDTIARTIKSERWPLPQSAEYRLHLDGSTMLLSANEPKTPARITYSATSESAVFSSPSIAEPLTFAGPISLKLRLASSSVDADIFVTLRAYRPDGTEATFYTAADSAPVSMGWLRASHRRVDPQRSGFLRPFHPHADSQPLRPGEDYDLDVELWPASLHLPEGSRLELTVKGHDFVRPESAADIDTAHTEGEHKLTLAATGSIHDHPADRPLEKFGGDHTISTGPGVAAYLSLPRVVAPK